MYGDYDNPGQRAQGPYRWPRQDLFLRMPIIYSARAVLAAAHQQGEPDAVHALALARSARLGHNKAAAALANRLARYAWAVATRETHFEVTPLAA